MRFMLVPPSPAPTCSLISLSRDGTSSHLDSDPVVTAGSSMSSGTPPLQLARERAEVRSPPYPRRTAPLRSTPWAR